MSKVRHSAFSRKVFLTRNLGKGAKVNGISFVAFLGIVAIITWIFDVYRQERQAEREKED